MSQTSFFVIQWKPLNNPALLPAQASEPPDAFFNVRWRPTQGLSYYPETAVLTQPATAFPTG
ncbi:hypothetical protein JOE39_003586 [Pseudomonas sp. PvP100]|uniref:Uncharacterized protein n=1 Tax=Pseudomonas syringae TaxID=317 RepID=A0AB38C078_PSESX|nr:hypothetical protein [Pseudomonas syringae]MBP1088562.1 hypothetical protein [Pseudomonas sp. PvP007]MBP1195607.1 hypothetical protein [Pseudomonas sp. PvP100]SFO48433.1 hypothetical protein SAMN05444065_12245 [Pseudomonas syringae]SFO83970.1 hypothetical protein SAMN05444063_12345 [Pseudomonas syringae]